MILLKTWLKFELFQIFKILLITVVVLVLGGGIGEISSLFCCVFSKSLYIFAVFERRGNKDCVVAADSFPSPYGWLRDCLVAETVQTLVFLDSYRFFSLNEDPVQVLAVCEELPVHVLDLVDGCWFFSLKGELVY